MELAEVFRFSLREISSEGQELGDAVVEEACNQSLCFGAGSADTSEVSQWFSCGVVFDKAQHIE
jgi:hypothetical protein